MDEVIYPRFGTNVHVLAGNIARLEYRVDAIVSPDDNYLSHGGGASAALWRAAGSELDEWSVPNVGDLALGEVIVGPAGALHADWLMHAITVDYDANEALGYSEAVRLYGQILDEAADRGWHSIATPVLGSGVAGLAPAESAGALRSALQERRLDHAVPTVLHVVTNAAQPETFYRVAAVFGRPHTDGPSPADRLRRATAIDAEARRMFLDQWDAALADPSPQAAERLFTVALIAIVERLVPPGAEDGTRSQMPLAELFRLVEDGYRRHGWDVPAAVASAYQTGCVARNRVVHQRTAGAAQRNLRRALLQAAGDLVEALVSLSWDTGPLEGLGPSDVDQPLAALSPPGDVVQPLDAVSGIALDPIHALQQFVLTRLPKADRNDLLGQLRQKGYVGTDEACILEHCVRASPLGILTDNFTARQLRSYLAAGGQKVPSGADLATLASRVLQNLGFRVERMPASPKEILRKVRDTSARLDFLSSDEISGRVAHIANDLEASIQQLLRFLCRSALQVDANQWALERGVINPPKTLSKATLGDLLAGLNALAKDIASLSGPQADEFARDFGTNVTIPYGNPEIAHHRNQLAHAQEPGSHGSLSTQIIARDFLSAAQRLLDDLLRSDTTEPLFPTIIQVSSIITDEWGRRLVHARDDQRRPELIFTSQPVDAGRVYLMRPLSNPLRVDPILMPVGDIKPSAGRPDPDARRRQRETP